MATIQQLRADQGDVIKTLKDNYLLMGIQPAPDKAATPRAQVYELHYQRFKALDRDMRNNRAVNL